MNAVLEPEELHEPSPQTILAGSSLPELRRISVESTSEEVILTGRVSSYYVKQMAQEALRGTIGSRKITNRVIVSR